MVGDITNELIKNIYRSLLFIYQENGAEKNGSSVFFFGYVDRLFYMS